MFHLGCWKQMKLREVHFGGGGNVNFPIVNAITCLGESSKKARGKFFIDKKVKIRFGSL